jgi:hypothetical protein
VSGSPAKPAAPAAPGAGAPQGGDGKQPFGNSSATQPTQNAGMEAAALQRVGVVIKQLQDVMQMVGAASEPGKDLLKALNILVKMVPAGNVSNASERNMLEQSLMRNTQNGQQQQMLKQSMQQKASGGGAPGAGAPQGAGAAA